MILRRRRSRIGESIVRRGEASRTSSRVPVCIISHSDTDTQIVVIDSADKKKKNTSNGTRL